MADVRHDRATRPDPTAFGRAIAPGLGVNLLVRSVAASACFHAEVLGAVVVWQEDDFAVLTLGGATWLLHGDAAYARHPMRASVEGVVARGAGIELRPYGTYPDVIEARARDRGALVLASTEEKPHGLRESYVVDPDGYVWVPCRAS